MDALFAYVFGSPGTWILFGIAMAFGIGYAVVQKIGGKKKDGE